MLQITQGIPTSQEVSQYENKLLSNAKMTKMIKIAALLGSGLFLTSLALCCSPLTMPFAVTVVLISTSAVAALVSLIAIALLIKANKAQAPDPFETKIGKIKDLLKQYPPLDQETFDVDAAYRHAVNEYPKMAQDQLRNELALKLEKRDLQALLLLMFIEKETLNQIYTKGSTIDGGLLVPNDTCLLNQLLNWIDVTIYEVDSSNLDQRQAILFEGLLRAGVDYNQQIPRQRNSMRDKIQGCRLLESTFKKFQISKVFQIFAALK